MDTTADGRRVARLVIRAPNWLGDAVLALPALAAVRAALPDTHITIASRRSVAPLYDERTSARQDAVLTLDDPGRDAAALSAGRFDAALLLTNSFRSAWTTRRAGIGQRWGYAGAARGWLLTTAVARPRHRVHLSDYYRQLVAALGWAAEPCLPRVEATDRSNRRAEALLRQRGVVPEARCVGFAPGAAYGHAKRWPPRRVAETIVRLSREHGVTCLLVGAAADRAAGREIESSLPGDVTAVDLIGQTDLRLLTGVIARCSAFVSNDSGAMHLAAALGVPVAAIFGPTDDRVTAPLGVTDVLIHQVFCRPCMLRDCPIDHRCMKGIAPAEVVAAVARRLEARA